MREYEERELIPVRFKNLPKRISQTRLENLLDPEGQAHYRAANGKLIWVTCQVRCDCACKVSQASSRLGKATEGDAIFVNKIIDWIEQNPLQLNYYKLADPKVPRRLRACCDAAFKRKDERDDKSRGGYLLCIGTEEYDLVGVIGYGTQKIHRVCKSPTGAEVVTITATGDQMDVVYHLLFWFYPTANPVGELLTDAYSVTSSQHKYCGDVSANLQVDFALVRQRVRDGLFEMKHQLGQFNAADGLTKATTVANDVLMQFLKSNRLGAKGVEMSKIEAAVSAKLTYAFERGKIHPNNLNETVINNIANAVNAQINGLNFEGKWYTRSLE
jgi:hypothetical protein